VNTVIDPDQFTHELGGWVLRGMLCAVVSFAWALVADFSSPAEIAGMVAGITAWAALFAGLCAWHGQQPGRGPVRVVSAFKIAAWIKFATSAAGGLMFAFLSLGPKDTMVDLGVVAVLPDCMLGMLSVCLVAGLSGTNMEALVRLDSFGWTALTTLVDGALFFLVITALAGGVLAWWRFGPGLLLKLKLSPPRFAR